MLRDIETILEGSCHGFFLFLFFSKGFCLCFGFLFPPLFVKGVFVCAFFFFFFFFFRKRVLSVPSFLSFSVFFCKRVFCLCLSSEPTLQNCGSKVRLSGGGGV